jgi:hypothetical protein
LTSPWLAAGHVKWTRKKKLHGEELLSRMTAKFVLTCAGNRDIGGGENQNEIKNILFTTPGSSRKAFPSGLDVFVVVFLSSLPSNLCLCRHFYFIFPSFAPQLEKEEHNETKLMNY